VRVSASRSRPRASTTALSIMSPEDAFGPRPPPPPPLATSPHTTAPSGQGSPLHHAPQISPLRRLAVQPPRLRTVALAPHGTAASASNSLSVPYSPFAAPTPSTYAPSPSAYTPSPSPYASSPLPSASPMAMRNTSVPYNPQQWSRTGPTGGQYAPHTAVQAATRPHDVTGMEGNSRPFLKPELFYVAFQHVAETIRPSLCHLT
jgi:hypothetical protein